MYRTPPAKRSVEPEDENYEIEEVISPQKNQTMGNVLPLDEDAESQRRKRKRSKSPFQIVQEDSTEKNEEDYFIEEIQDTQHFGIPLKTQSGGVNLLGRTDFEAPISAGQPSIYEIVSYNLRNTRTLRRQIEKYTSSIELDVAILYVWSVGEGGSWQALVKDADNMFSVIINFLDTTTAVVQAGQRIRFENLIILKRITPAVSSSLFAVFEEIGHPQLEYFQLCMTGETKMTNLPCSVISIPFEGMEFDSYFTRELESFKFSSVKNAFVPK